MRGTYCFKIFIYPSFSFWCLGVVSFWSGVLKRHLWPHMGVEVRAGLSRFRCSTPDMLQNWSNRQTRHLSRMAKCHLSTSTLWGSSQAEVGIRVCEERKTDFIYSWRGEWQWLGGRFLGRIWYIFQEGGAGPVAQRRRFPPFFSLPPPNWCMGGFGWVDRSQGGDTAQTKWSTVLITTRDGSGSVDCVAHWTVNCPLLQETGVACLVVPWWCCCLWHVETGHVAPRNRVLQKKTHLQ